MPCLQSVYLHKFTLAPLTCKVVVFPLSNSFIKLIGSILRFIFIFMLLTFFFGTAKTHQCSRLVSCAVLPLNGSVFSFSGVQFKPADGISTFLVYCFVLCFVTALLGYDGETKTRRSFFVIFSSGKNVSVGVCWQAHFKLRLTVLTSNCLLANNTTLSTCPTRKRFYVQLLLKIMRESYQVSIEQPRRVGQTEEQQAAVVDSVHVEDLEHQASKRWKPYEDSKYESPVLNRLFPWPRYYYCRWKILNLFHTRLLFGIALGELLVFVLLIGGLAAALGVIGLNDDEGERTGSIANIAPALSFAFACRNSL